MAGTKNHRDKTTPAPVFVADQSASTYGFNFPKAAPLPPPSLRYPPIRTIHKNVIFTKIPNSLAPKDAPEPNPFFLPPTHVSLRDVLSLRFLTNFWLLSELRRRRYLATRCFPATIFELLTSQNLVSDFKNQVFNSNSR